MKIFWFELFSKWENIQFENPWKQFWFMNSRITIVNMWFTLLYNIYRENVDIKSAIRDKKNLMIKSWYYFQDNKWEMVNNKQAEFILNSNQSFDEFKNLFVVHSNISWNVFILKLRNIQGTIIWLQILDTRTMKIIYDDYWNILHYEQSVKWNTNQFPKEDIYHYKKDIDVNNPTMWLSSLEWVVYDILADKEAALSNYNFFKNSAIPSSIIKFKEWISEEEIKIVMEQLKANFSWWWNKHKIGAMTWIDWIERLQQSFKDMEFLLLREFTTERICTSLWVPKIRLNKVDVKYSNYKEIYQSYIEGTIRPEEQDFANVINNIFKEIFKWELTFEYHDKHIIDEDAKLNRYILEVNNWLKTINEIRQEMWVDIYEVEEADQPIIPLWKTLLEDVGISWLQEE